MRVDKFLKISRIIKRRTVAKEACDTDRITINGKPAKPGAEVKVGDIIVVRFGNSETKAKIISLDERVSKQAASEMYEIIE